MEPVDSLSDQAHGIGTPRRYQPDAKRSMFGGQDQSRGDSF
jgi:hypothetical protein